MLLTVAEVAKYLRTNPATVYKFYHEGKLKLIKIGSLKCTEDSLKEFLANMGETGGDDGE